MRHLSERCALVPVKTVPNYFTCLCTCHAIFCHKLEMVFIELNVFNNEWRLVDEKLSRVGIHSVLRGTIYYNIIIIIIMKYFY